MATTRARTRPTKAAAKKPTATAAAKARRRAEPPSPLTKAAAKQALAREGKKIATLQKDVDANVWQIGRRLLQIAELGLAEPAGFPSVVDYAEVKHGIARTTAFSYMRVADAFPEGVVRAFGVEKLDRALAYIAKTPEAEEASDIPKLRVRVPDAAGNVHEKRFAEATVKDLRLAASHENRVHGTRINKRRVDPNVAEHAAALAAANRALDAIVGKSNAARAEVTLQAVDGLVLADVRGVPLARLAAALKAVAHALA